MRRRILSAGGGKFIEGYIILDQLQTDPSLKVIDMNGSTYSGYSRPAVIDAIRAASHCYVGTYDSTNEKMVLKQLSDTDGTKYADGTNASSDITSDSKNVFMRLPFFFTRVSTYGASSLKRTKIEFAYDVNQTAMETAVPEGDNWKQWGGNDLIGKYKAYIDGTVGQWSSNKKAHSKSGVKATQDKFIYFYSSGAYIGGEGSSYKGLISWYHHCIMGILFYAYYGHTDSQAICGEGASAIYGTTGLKNSLGMTDTTPNNSSDGIVFWGLENWWGGGNEILQYNNDQTYGTFHFVMEDGTIRNVQISNYGSSVIPVQFILGKNLDLLYTGTTSTSTAEGYCDRSYAGSSSNCCITRAGFASDIFTKKNPGISYMSAGSSYTSASGSTRLAYRGPIEITT